MAKFTPKTVKRIVELIEEDIFNTKEICEIVGISRKTYYEWMDVYPDFREEVEMSRDLVGERLAQQARRALREQMDGYKVMETVITYVPDKSEATGYRVKKKVEKMKEYPPKEQTMRHAIERGEKRERDRRWRQASVIFAFLAVKYYFLPQRAQRFYAKVARGTATRGNFCCLFEKGKIIETSEKRKRPDFSSLFTQIYRC